MTRALLLLALLFAAPAVGQESRTQYVRRRAAIERGLEYLARNQNRDGSFGARTDGLVGITALSVLAFMSQGYEEGRGKYANFRPARGERRDVLRRGIDFLLSKSLPPGERNPYISQYGKPTGYIYEQGDADSRMHGHGYATQVLVLAYGSRKASDRKTRDLFTAIKRAIRVIENAQTNTGGWGYEPKFAGFHEGSITVTVVQALRLATDAGFIVDKSVRDRGLAYLRDSQKSDGSFKYSLMQDTSTAALTAAALTAMHGFGEYYSKAARKGLGYIYDRYRSQYRMQWPFYANYYAAQVFYRAGGKYWRFWQSDIERRILSEQLPGGFWDDRNALSSRKGSHGRAYATALSVLALSVSDGYLPLFQR